MTTAPRAFHPTAVGLDVGYSATKGATAETVFSFASAAGPVEMLPDRFGAADDTLLVAIDGQTWAAGIEPTRLQGRSRVLHKDYTCTKQYKALFFAGLVRAGYSSIDCLATGLPVTQYNDKSLREALRTRLEGVHRPAQDVEIEVKKVYVYPQPVGTWAEALAEESGENAERFTRARILVLDPGYYSVDYTVISGGELRQKSSGTSTLAMATLIERVSYEIRRVRSGSPSVDEIEMALRLGRPLEYRGTEIDLKTLVQGVAADMVPDILDDVRSAIRQEGDPDIVVLTGGGAATYESAARRVFEIDGTRVIIPKDPSTANAQGFLRLAQAKATP